ncbi:hypothetical protein [Pseudomonas cichorii]|uniref:hypothetical protein n=1 Tax=Pseudomonas cichorii TaxID=36746 RepID=UPI000F00F11A|nr:hypothetical protein [Pseudomonas cichorii]
MHGLALLKKDKTCAQEKPDAVDEYNDVADHFPLHERTAGILSPIARTDVSASGCFYFSAWGVMLTSRFEAVVVSVRRELMHTFYPGFLKPLCGRFASLAKRT